MKFFKSPLFHLILLIIGAIILRFFFDGLLEDHNALPIRIFSIGVILFCGVFFVLNGTAKIIEETTSVLSHRTKLAGGMLQSIGTAFPDMVLGIVAAIISLRLGRTDYSAAVNYAIIAAA